MSGQRQGCWKCQGAGDASGGRSSLRAAVVLSGGGGGEPYATIVTALLCLWSPGLLFADSRT